MEWRKLDNVRYTRQNHTADLIKKSVYLFGGECNMTYKNDL